MAKAEKYDGKHRAEDQKDKLSTAERTKYPTRNAQRTNRFNGFGMGSRNLKGSGHGYSRGDSE